MLRSVQPVSVCARPSPSWGLSTLETTAGLAALAAGFREAIPGRELSPRGWISDCLTEAAAFSISALAVAGWLVSRALSTRPLLTGAACGLGVGMMADAGLRLFCRDGDLFHVLVAHGGAIALMMLGALGARFIERRKVQR